jgi:FAD/FMN-containing dehydrogenase
MVGPKAVDVMKRIKLAFDPDGRLNPGKIFRADKE